MKRYAALIKKMTTQKLIDKITKQIDQILNESGLIVFSSVDTLVKGDIYTLGLNPGGEAKIPIIKTILEFPSRHHNAYIDENWGNRKKAKYPVGGHPLQRNFTGLIRAIGYEPDKVFSSNLIFTRSRGQNNSHYPDNANLCWTVHKEFINIVDPNCFIVFGNSNISPYQFIKDKYSLKTNDSISSGHGNWKCFSASGIIEGRERILIGIPHLSRYYVTRHDNVIKWITSKIK